MKNFFLKFCLMATIKHFLLQRLVQASLWVKLFFQLAIASHLSGNAGHKSKVRSDSSGHKHGDIYCELVMGRAAKVAVLYVIMRAMRGSLTHRLPRQRWEIFERLRRNFSEDQKNVSFAMHNLKIRSSTLQQFRK